MTDSILVNKDARMLVLLPAAIIVLYTLNVAVRFFHAFLGRVANERIMRDVREKLFSHYLGLSSAFFTESSVGALISRIMNDVFYVSHGTIGLASFARDLVTFLALFLYALKLNPKLFLLTLIIAPLLTWLSKRSGVLMKGYAKKMQEANANISSVLQEAFSGFRIVKAFGLERFAFDRFKERNDGYVTYALKGARVEEIGGPSVEFMGALAVALALYVGGHDVISGKLSAGELFAFFTCFGLMINPIRTLNDLNMKLNQAGASADRIDETLKIVSQIQNAPHAKPLQINQASIEFQNLGFRYDADLPFIFQKVNFVIPRGKMVAIVGASGQGKSTLVNLLLRFYDPTEGCIVIDGQNIQNVTLESLRSQIGFVSQDVFLFNDTIYANIELGRQSASREEIYEAARVAHVLPFIENFPDGFNTIVGDRGQRLSGGERQRISIARAVLRNSPILILDEATSNLDSESEKTVQDALENLIEGRTTLVIAHRLSTIKHAHRILVLANGKIQEAGTHDELIEAGGEYAKFYQLFS